MCLGQPHGYRREWHPNGRLRSESLSEHGFLVSLRRWDEDGRLVKGLPRHPTVEDDVVIYAGATILGRITIGKGATIGGNVWLTRSVPPGSTVSQAQARHEAFEGGAGI